MSIKSLKTGAYGRSVMAGNSLILPGDYESIATVTVGVGGINTVSFTSIPQTFQHLQLRFFGKIGQTTGALTWWFNGDSTGTSYSVHLMRGDGSTTAAYSYVSQPYLTDTISPTTIWNNGNYTVGIIDMLDYTNTNKYKTTRQIAGIDNNGTGCVEIHSGLWMNTAAINNITLYSGYGNLAQYSHFALYGVR